MHAMHSAGGYGCVRLMWQWVHAESQKQYWQVKSKYRDTIIFFKVGKFYELYEVGFLPLTYSMSAITVA